MRDGIAGAAGFESDSPAEAGTPYLAGLRWWWRPGNGLLCHVQARPNRSQPRHGLARVLSKLGFCSRSQAGKLIAGGRVRVNGVLRRNPEWPVDQRRDRIEVDDQPVRLEQRVYLMLNKPRGLVTTASDERGRQTVFKCLADRGLPFVAPVGRLDQASEGLLLFTNDTAWAAGITDPETHLQKVYHVQVDCLAEEDLLRQLVAGRQVDGDFLAVKRARVLRHGARNSWLEIALEEGKNRHLRRLLEALGVRVMRLVRVSVGSLELGALPKGQFRQLTVEEMRLLATDRGLIGNPKHQIPKSKKAPNPKLQAPEKHQAPRFG